MRRLSRTESRGKTSRPSGTWQIPRRTIQAGSLPWIASPRYRTEPFCGSRMPDMVLSTVVLPAPFAPNTVTMDPRGTASDTPRIAFTGP